MHPEGKRLNRLFMWMNLGFIIMLEMNRAGVHEANSLLVKGKADLLKS